MSPLLAAFGNIDKDALADALAAFHARNLARSEPAQGRTSARTSYEAARRTLRERERRLGNERSMVEQVLAEMGPPRPALAELPQQELHIVGPAGRSTAGRFRLLNTFDRPLQLTFAPGFREGGQPPPPLTFSPARVEIGPRRDLVVRLEIDLSDERGGEQWTIPVDVNEGPRLRQRLWVTVRCLTRASSEPANDEASGGSGR